MEKQVANVSAARKHDNRRSVWYRSLLLGEGSIRNDNAKLQIRVVGPPNACNKGQRYLGAALFTVRSSLKSAPPISVFPPPRPFSPLFSVQRLQSETLVAFIGGLLRKARNSWSNYARKTYRLVFRPILSVAAISSTCFLIRRWLNEIRRN